MSKKEIVYCLIIILVIIIAIFTIRAKEQKDKENINEATQDIAISEGINGYTSKIVQEPKEYVKISADGTRENKSEKITSEKTVGDLVISNILLTSDGKDTFIKADVKSIGDKEIPEKELQIDLLKEDGSVWISVNSIISKTNDKNLGKINLTITGYDFTNTYDIKVSIK